MNYTPSPVTSCCSPLAFNGLLNHSPCVLRMMVRPGATNALPVERTMPQLCRRHTRWQCARLLSIKEQSTEAIAQVGAPCLSQSCWPQIESQERKLKPVHRATQS